MYIKMMTYQFKSKMLCDNLTSILDQWMRMYNFIAPSVPQKLICFVKGTRDCGPTDRFPCNSSFELLAGMMYCCIVSVY